MSSKYNRKLYKSAERMIASDGHAIVSLVLYAPYKTIISVLLLPYVGVYCREAQEFYKKTLMDGSVDEQITDLRNTIKIFSGKYNKTEKAFLASDNDQDEEFRGKLRFDFTKTMNIHYNLGVYFDGGGHVIGDTQLIAFYFSSVNVDTKNGSKEVFELGKKIGIAIRRIMMLAKSKAKVNSNKVYKELKVGYIDYNTNISDELFVYTEDKGINLLFLHLLGMLGTSKYLLREICGDNTWAIRCEYIILHSIWSMFKVTERHFEFKDGRNENVDKIGKFVKKGQRFFPSELRNCMMHYDFVHNDVAYIDEKMYRPDIPFYGLVETCVGGISLTEYLAKLREYEDEIEDFLNSWFKFDLNEIKWDL